MNQTVRDILAKAEDKLRISELLLEEQAEDSGSLWVGFCGVRSM